VSVGLPDGDMQQILVNLVINASNAIASAGRTGTIAITSRALGTDRVELVVRDDGPGVAPEIASRLFELYATTSAHGTGVGLWLVKQIVSEVGGSIRYEPGIPGARFVIELPRRTS
jgi:signal transduction histidine kinase